MTAHIVTFLERTIDSSHVLPDHPGKCSRLHGHTYRFQIWMSGPIGADGMLVDFLDVKACIDEWDHRHLNDLVDFDPTAELLAAEMQRRILQLITDRCGEAPGVGVLVRLSETPSSWAQAGAIVPVTAGATAREAMLPEPVAT
jgi:6-pyruvoyltetrahydropterin/6-carboxytetrahydropterin synthase